MVEDNNKKISIPKVDFGSYDLVFIQGGNPVVSHPNTQKVINGLKNTLFQLCLKQE